jgi:hypothetical protein
VTSTLGAYPGPDPSTSYRPPHKRSRSDSARSTASLSVMTTTTLQATQETAAASARNPIMRDW